MSNIVGLIGVFDGMHQGHLNIINNASRMGNLYVGVVKDEAVKRVKGEGRPLFDEEHRLAIVKNLRNVANAFLVEDFDASLVQGRNLTFDIFVRGEDQDHIAGFDKLNEHTLIVTLKRTPDVSTTKLAERLK
jgi:cytidyltransferase-like protein